MRNTLATLTILAATQVAAYGDPWDREAYAGGLVNAAMPKWQVNYGHGSMADKAYGGELLAGYKFDQQIGLEINYLYLTSPNQQNTYAEDSTVLGREVPNYQETHRAKYDINGWGASLAWYSDYFWDDYQLYITLGLAHLSAKVHHTHVSSIAVAGMNESYINVESELSTKRKLVPKFGVGVNAMCSESFAIRGDLSWYNTGKLSGLNDSSGQYTAKMSDTFKIGVGCAFYF